MGVVVGLRYPQAGQLLTGMVMIQILKRFANASKITATTRLMVIALRAFAPVLKLSLENPNETPQKSPPRANEDKP